MDFVAPSLLLLLGLTAPQVSDLKAEYRDGQTFLTWRESGDLADARFEVWSAAQPLTSLAGAVCEAKGLLPGSAVDWWLNPETYGAPTPAAADGSKPAPPRQGWIINEGQPRLDPNGGLFVHTVRPETAGSRFYAVVVAGDPPVVEPGVNSLTQPVRQEVATTQPIWQGNPAAKPAVGTGRGLPLDLQLHAKRGRGGMEWLWFGDRELGWRDGLPFKFGAQARGGSVVLTPTDRTWIDRLMPEGKDECQRLTPAIHSFWFGYNERINEPAAMPGAPVVNYTERRLLTLVQWAQGYFDTDRQRSYCTGGSMGGCGTISFGFRHPEIFAACSAIVPIVAFDRGPGGDSAMRIEVECGGLEALTSAGLPVKEHLDSTRFATQHPDDLPFLFIVTGRNDSSIPWWKNPAFYRALRDGRHGFIAAWNEGAHGDTQAKLPPDLAQRASLAWLHRFALDQSYLAFSNSSADDDPGQGGKSEGTPAGAFNRGLDFEPPVESSTSYEAAVLWYLEPARLPITVDITPRRRQQFRPAPGSRVLAENVGADGVVTQRIETTVAPAGTLTVPGFSLTSARQMLRLRLAE